MKPEVDEASQVEGGGSQAEADAVAFDAAEADASVAVGDEPGDGALDHRVVLAVVVEAGACCPVGPCLCEQLVVVADFEGLAVLGAGAVMPGRAGGASRSEDGVAGGRDSDGPAGRPRDGAGRCS